MNTEDLKGLPETHLQPARPAAIVTRASDRIDPRIPSGAHPTAQRCVYPKMQPKRAAPPIVRQPDNSKKKKL